LAERMIELSLYVEDKLKPRWRIGPERRSLGLKQLPRTFGENLRLRTELLVRTRVETEPIASYRSSFLESLPRNDNCSGNPVTSKNSNRRRRRPEN